MGYFLGREQKISCLSRPKRSKNASLVVIKGRRRVGKSRLVEEFARGKTFLGLSGLPPNTTGPTSKENTQRVVGNGK